MTLKGPRMIPDLTDTEEWPDEELDRLRIAVATEQERRQTLATAAAQAEQIAARYAQAVGRRDGDEWAAPTGAHDAYAEGATVAHNGRTWVSTTPANVWEPGVSGWREQADPGDETPPDWRQPTGGHDAYRKSDTVTFEGAAWESLIDSNVWSPAAYPQGWRRLD